MNIGEGDSSKTSKPKTTSTANPKDKGKGVHVEPSTEEKKRMQEIEDDKIRNLTSIMRQKKDDPPSFEQR